MSHWRRNVGGAALAVMLVLLASAVVKLIISAGNAFGYPYDLDYGEGIVWQQMDNIVAGRGYAPLGTFPAIVYHYPPVYHLLTALMAAMMGLDPLLAGRLVSFIATLAAMACVGWLCRATAPKGPAGLIGSLAAALAFGASPTVVVWASLMRVDLLATALTLAGLCLTVRELAAPRRISWAAVVFALAVYTKQTAIIAPIAAFVTLWLARPASAWRFAALSVTLGLGGLAMMMASTGGGFLRHIVSYNVNRFAPDQWRSIVRVLASQAVTLSVAVTVTVRIVLTWGRTWRARLRTPAEAAKFLLIFYGALRVATVPLALKSGASENYFIDLFSVAAALLGIGVSEIAAAVLEQARWPRALLTLLILIGMPVQAARVVTQHRIVEDARLRAENDALVARIHAARRPVISDYMVLIRRAGRSVLFEPAIVAELAHSRMYDETRLVAMIRRHAFAFILTQGASEEYAQRYNPAVRAAIEAAYPRTEVHGEAVLRLPLSQDPAAPPPA